MIFTIGYKLINITVYFHPLFYMLGCVLHFIGIVMELECVNILVFAHKDINIVVLLLSPPKNAFICIHNLFVMSLLKCIDIKINFVNALSHIKYICEAKYKFLLQTRVSFVSRFFCRITQLFSNYKIIFVESNVNFLKPITNPTKIRHCSFILHLLYILCKM